MEIRFLGQWTFILHKLCVIILKGCQTNGELMLNILWRGFHKFSVRCNHQMKDLYWTDVNEHLTSVRQTWSGQKLNSWKTDVKDLQLVFNMCSACVG